MHPGAGLAGAVLGAAAGPLLAGLTVRVPSAGPWLSAGWWWGGAGAGAARRALLAVLGAVAAGLAGLGVGWVAALPAYLWFALAAAVLAVIDVEHHRLPNRLVYPTYAAGLVLLGVAAVAGAAGAAYLRGLAAMAALYGLFLLLALGSPGSLGLGDVKLAGVLGLYLGYLGAARLALGVAVGVALGAVAALVLLAARRAGWRSELAYGPALLAGSVVALGLGQPLLDAYLGVGGLR